MDKRYYKSGQIGIIAVLVGVVIFTMGMATAARITTDIRIASRTEEGARAYAAAESAMEIAMAQADNTLSTTAAGTWNGGDTYIGGDYTVTAQPNRTQVPYVYDFTVNEGNARTIWLVKMAESPIPNVSPLHVSLQATAYSEPFQVNWIGADTASTADQRVEISLYWRNTANQILVKRWFKAGENYVIVDPTNATDLPNFAQYYLVRIKPIVGNISARIIPDPTSGADDFPIQEFSIVANGWTTAVAGQVRRRTVGTRIVGELPLYLDYVIANGVGNLSKQ